VETLRRNRPWRPRHTRFGRQTAQPGL